MSWCEIIPFEGELPQEGIEFTNSWGGAARIWEALFGAYLKDPDSHKLYDSWLFNPSGLSSLARRSDLPVYERVVLASTFDLAYVGRANFGRFAASLRLFVQKYPTGHAVDHLPAWAEWIEQSDAQAVGFYATSCGDNLWRRIDEETEEYVGVPLSEGFEVYQWLADQNAIINE